MPRTRLPLDWTVACSRGRVRASVPGAVQLDWAAAHGWPAVEWAGNAADYGWMEDERWTYAATLPEAEVPAGHVAVLVLEGVDYAALAHVGGKWAGVVTGMHSRLEVDVTGRGGEAVEVEIAPVPKVPGARDGRREAAGAVKPAVSYGWDFCPRLVPLGLWRPAYVEVRPAAAVESAEVLIELDDDLGSADLSASVELYRRPAKMPRVNWTVTHPDGGTIVDDEWSLRPRELRTRRIESPKLWWPRTHGTPHLYRSTLTVTHADGTIETFEQRIGLRRVRLVMHAGAWDEPAAFDFPKPRSNPPTTFEVNGLPVFAKGTNVVAPDLFPFRLDTDDGRDRYDTLLEIACDCGFNFLRLWGGAVAPPEHFYDRCDELGLMCWQEFPLSCNCYPESEAYLRTLEADARSLVHRLARHPSLVLWCGGNELFNSWSGMTDQHPALRLLAAVCWEMDPRRPFVPTMPVMGVAHGCYLFRLPEEGGGREVHQYLPAASYTAYPEFGVPSPAPVGTIERIIPEAERFPPERGGAWGERHAFDAWNVSFDTWFEVATIRDYFGDAADLATLVEWGQLLQAEGLRFAYEEARRQSPKCSMILNWCFNEPWPTAANNSIVAWPATPKPACAAVKSACRPTLLSLRLPRFAWRAGDVIEAELWLLNDSDDDLPATTATARVGDRTATLDVPATRPRSNARAGVVRLAVPPGDGPTFEVQVSAEGRDGWSNGYTLCRRPTRTTRARTS